MWGEYRLGDLFDIENTLSFNKDQLTIGSEYDYITRTSQNQGILQETGFVNQENINPAGTWSLGLLQMDFFYREKPWYAGQFVRKIISKIELTKNKILFFSVILNKQKNNLLSGLVRDVDQAFLNAMVSLPAKNGKIDSEFIEGFMAELEAVRLAELEAYLTTTGLRDYTLTAEEERVLKDFESGKWTWAEWKIKDLFEKLNLKFLKSKFDKEKDISKEKSQEFNLPLVNAKNGDNGIMYYGRTEDFESAEMTIDIVGDGAISTGNVYPQPQTTGVLYNAYLIKPKFEANKKLLHFFTSTIQKSIKLKFGYENKAGWVKVSEEQIHVPTNNNQPDYTMMETFISAIQKLIIRDVVLYSDSKIAATKEIISK